MITVFAFIGGIISGLLAIGALIFLGMFIWAATHPYTNGYSRISNVWRLIPHRHHWRSVVSGFDIQTHETLWGMQCTRCWKSTT